MLTRRPIWRSVRRANLAGREEAIALPPVGIGGARGTYHCSLSQQPSYLVPARLLADDVSVDDTLIMNPAAMCCSRDGDVPARLADCFPLPDEFLDGDLVWLCDAGAATWGPFWIDAATRDVLSRLGPEQLAPRDLPLRMRAALAFAGVLVRADGKQGQSLGDAFDDASRSFQARGYCPINGLIHPFHLGSLRRYYRRLVRTGGMTLGDSGSPLRFVSRDDRVSRFFHRQLGRVVSAITAVPVVPTYSYVTAYQGGAELPPHTDRAECEYSISLLVDFTPEPDELSPWPLHLSTADGRVTHWQALGDGLLYRGRQLPHSRDRLPEDMTSTSMLFHFVERDFMSCR